MDPVLGREVVEREQRLAILRQALGRLRVFGAVAGQELIERGLGIRLGLRHPDFVQCHFGGVRGLVGGRTFVLGNTTLMQQLGVDVSVLAAQAEARRGQGAGVMHLAVDGRLAGVLVVSDTVKATTPDALAALRRAGLRIVMATGDGLTTARAVGQRLGIDESSPPKSCGWSSACSVKAASWRWPEMGSTTRPHSRAPMSASRWAPAPTWQ